MTKEEINRFKNGGKIRITAKNWLEQEHFYYHEPAPPNDKYCVILYRREDWMYTWGTMKDLAMLLLKNVGNWEWIDGGYEPKYIYFNLED